MLGGEGAKALAEGGQLAGAEQFIASGTSGKLHVRRLLNKTDRSASSRSAVMVTSWGRCVNPATPAGAVAALALRGVGVGLRFCEYERDDPSRCCRAACCCAAACRAGGNACGQADRDRVGVVGIERGGGGGG